MLKQPNSERRLHPRLDRELPMHIAVDGYSFVTTTQNISCAGAYCRINKYMPPFTKLAIKMTLPIRHPVKKDDSLVECKGVIVRTDDEQSGGFNIAIFFNEIKELQRKKIIHYISQFLTDRKTCLSSSNS